MPARTRRASSARAEAPEECPENSGGNNDAVVLHGGLTLRERWIDADTVEYAVRRSLRDAFARSSAIAWFALALALFGASLATGELSGDAIGARVPHPPLLAAGFLTAILAARAAASCVVSESILVMRRVGVRLTTRRALARPLLALRRRRPDPVHRRPRSRHELDVFHYMCFRPFPRRAGSNPPRKVISPTRISDPPCPSFARRTRACTTPCSKATRTTIARPRGSPEGEAHERARSRATAGARTRANPSRDPPPGADGGVTARRGTRAGRALGPGSVGGRTTGRRRRTRGCALPDRAC